MKRNGLRTAGFRHDLTRRQQLVSESRLLEIGCDGLATFVSDHIPGAGYLDTMELEQVPFWNKVPDGALLQRLLRHGIRHDTTVILYSRSAVMAARAACEIEAIWSLAGIDRDSTVAFYCGTGWRASLAFLYAWLMGWEHISVYDGGWYEWSADPHNPAICRSQMGSLDDSGHVSVNCTT